MQVEARGPTLKLQFAGPSTQRDNNTHTDTVLRLYTHLYKRVLVLSCRTNINSAIYFCDANNHAYIHTHTHRQCCVHILHFIVLSHGHGIHTDAC